MTKVIKLLLVGTMLSFVSCSHFSKQCAAKKKCCSKSSKQCSLKKKDCKGKSKSHKQCALKKKKK